MPRKQVQIQLRLDEDLEDPLWRRLAELGDHVSRNAWINRVIRYQLQQPVTVVETEERI